MINNIDHPSYYGGADNVYEAIKVIDAWQLNFCLGNAVKYISRCGRKAGNPSLQDLQKAAWYLNHEIENIKSSSANNVCVRTAGEQNVRNAE